jgi:predicted dehydrogenase/threonine dehydrogenase-like Zn-dependent dehydrogenase
MQKNALRPAAIGTEEVPAPRPGESGVLLANRYSLISAGTEGATVRRNKRDMISKALHDPDLRQSVVDMVVDNGLRKTAERVQYEMTKWTPLGYSGAGVAVEVGPLVEGIRPGDRIAYAGHGHAEYIAASKHLCARVPDEVSMQEAAFVALGSIALQAVRRAEPEVGEVVAVLGLGLVGQLVSQMLQTAGARVVGSDLVPGRLKLAEQLGIERGFPAGPRLPADLLRYTNGLGADRVVICAATSGNEVIEQAVAMARDRGRIVVVGMVGMNVPSEDFYRKELDLVISRSYGPGRYDPQYEEQGIDYPRSYVRWTEQRNMQEFLRLVQSGKLAVKPLISHEFELEQAERGYEVLANSPSESLGVLLKYSEPSDPPPNVPLSTTSTRLTDSPTDRGNVAVIGCGAFARQFHLPNLKNHPQLTFHTLVASSGQSAKEMAVRYGAAHCTTDSEHVGRDPSIDAVMILTRDRSHAPLAAAALQAGKHVFCEKPLAISEADCRLVTEAAAASGRVCMVGFNRRFAPITVEAKRIVDEDSPGPKTVLYRVNAGSLPKDTWVYDPAHAAGRIVGEACHFIDLACWFIDAEPVRVSAQPMGTCHSSLTLEDVSATFEFSDGSLATIVYTAQGASQLPKERIEIFGNGTALVLDDFRRLTVRGRRRIDTSLRRADKGHAAELLHFAQAIRGEAAPQIDARDGVRATLCCLELIHSAREGQPRSLNLNRWLSPTENTDSSAGAHSQPEPGS